MEKPRGQFRSQEGRPRFTALLDVEGPGGHRTSLPFRPPRVLVGRKRDNDLSLPDQGVSSTHCEFVLEGGWFVVRDLGSVNGTFVNDQRVSEARLRDGDVVSMGETRITIALHGDVRGVSFWSLESARRHWLWLAAGAIALCLTGAAVYLRQTQLANDAQLRSRYASEVRALLQIDPCAALAPQVTVLGQLDARIAGRPVPIAAPGQKLPASARQMVLDLLGLYRLKADASAQATQALTVEQQKERDAFEKASRAAARLVNVQDRKIAYFAQAQLVDRMARSEQLLAGLTALTKEAQHFAELVESVDLRGEGLRAPDLAAFRFAARSATEQLASCRTDLSRTNAGAEGAINGLAEE